MDSLRRKCIVSALISILDNIPNIPCYLGRFTIISKPQIWTDCNCYKSSFLYNSHLHDSVLFKLWGLYTGTQNEYW